MRRSGTSGCVVRLRADVEGWLDDCAAADLMPGKPKLSVVFDIMAVWECSLGKEMAWYEAGIVGGVAGASVRMRRIRSSINASMLGCA